MSKKSNPQKRHRWASWAISIFALSAVSCAPPPSPQAEDLARRTEENIGCSTFKSEFFNGLYHQIISQSEMASPQDFQKVLQPALARSDRLKVLSARARADLEEQIQLLYQDLVQLPMAKENRLRVLTGVELGDRTDAQRSLIQTQLQNRLQNISALAEPVECHQGEPESPPPNTPETPGSPKYLLDHWKASRHPVDYGARKTMATYYQSCTAVSSNLITSSTTNVKGIKVVGQHPNGVGSIRVIQNLKALLQTHPYLVRYRAPDTQCFNVTSRPPIYDYGGKPWADVADPRFLNPFKDSGSGSPELGTDCSGFVFSSLVTSGLRLKAGEPNKAILVNGTNAKMLKEPQKNGLTCLEPVQDSKGPLLQSGDILASDGHVLIVDKVGADPFGIANIGRQKDCAKSKLSINNFDFSVIQSAPSKGGLGIFRGRGRDYLASNATMADSLLEYAQIACEARFGPVRMPANISARLIRHKLTSECREPETRLAGTACLAQCPAEL